MKMLGMFKTMQKLQTTAEFTSNFSPNTPSLLLAMQLSDLTSKRPSFFPVDLEQVFYEIVFGRKSLFYFFVIKFIILFYNGNLIAI